jgi:chlorobactene glucosyltransferase
VAAAVAHLETRDVAMLTLLPRIEMQGFWENVAMPMLGLTLFTFLPSWLANRVQIVAFGLGGGTGNLVRRADYDAAGGHEALKDAVVDDIALARLMRLAKRRTEVVRAEDYVSVRMYHGAREIIEGFTKNIFVAFGGSYVVTFLIIVGSLVFHLLPYALALTGNRWAIATVLLISLNRLILFRALGYSLFNALLLHPVMVAFWAYVFLRSMWYTGIRRKVLWRGRTYDASRTRFGAGR